MSTDVVAPRADASAAPAVAAAPPLVNREQQIRLEAARASFPVQSRDEVLRQSAKHLAEYAHPTNAAALHALEEAFRRQMRRDRGVILAWLFGEAQRFIGLYGGASEIARNREVFEGEVEPILAECGAGVDAWIATFRARGAWSE